MALNLLEIKKLHDLAESGDSTAQFELAYKYGRGDEVPKNNKEACKWYGRAANNGHRTAQLNLGNRFLTGNGVDRDNKLAHEWIRKSAEQGLPEAQHFLAKMYQKGEIVPQDSNLAHEWYQKAALQGFVYQGQPPSIWAAELGITGCIDFFCKKGLSFLNDSDSNGNSPLMVALKNGQIEYARSLLKLIASMSISERNSIINHSNSKGETALHYVAGRSDMIAFVPCLINFGAILGAVESGSGLKCTPHDFANLTHGWNSDMRELLTIISNIISCFETSYLEKLADRIRTSYLKQTKDDHLIDRKTLSEFMQSIFYVNPKNRSNEHALRIEFRSMFNKELQMACATLFGDKVSFVITYIEKINKLVFDVLENYLQVFYLYPVPMEMTKTPEKSRTPSSSSSSSYGAANPIKKSSESASGKEFELKTDRDLSSKSSDNRDTELNKKPFGGGLSFSSTSASSNQSLNPVTAQNTSALKQSKKRNATVLAVASSSSSSLSGKSTIKESSKRVRH